MHIPRGVVGKGTRPNVHRSGDFAVVKLLSLTRVHIEDLGQKRRGRITTKIKLDVTSPRKLNLCQKVVLLRLE